MDRQSFYDQSIHPLLHWDAEHTTVRVDGTRLASLAAIDLCQYLEDADEHLFITKYFQGLRGEQVVNHIDDDNMLDLDAAQDLICLLQDKLPAHATGPLLEDLFIADVNNFCVLNGTPVLFDNGN